jgi:hypothetical protein
LERGTVCTKAITVADMSRYLFHFGRDSRVSAAVRYILEVQARQYSAIQAYFSI